jgi:hypothetical protein
VGDEVNYDGYRLAVTAVDGHRAAGVRVTPPGVEDAGGADSSDGASGRVVAP